MPESGTKSTLPTQLVSNRFSKRVFLVFALLALLSLCISVAGKSLGHSMQLAGYSESTLPLSLYVNGNRLLVPANAIRFQGQRKDGVLPRLDLFLRWPELQGYNSKTRQDFNHAGSRDRIVFLTFEKPSMPFDMSARFEPIYRLLTVSPGQAGPSGLTIYPFKRGSGYEDEVLAVAHRDGKTIFAARCLKGIRAEQSHAACLRDIHINDGLSLTYRFPDNLLDQWQALEKAVQEKARQFAVPDHPS